MPRQVLVPILATSDPSGQHRNPVIIGWEWVTVFGDLEARQSQVYDAQARGEDEYFIAEFRRTEVDRRAPRKVVQREVIEEPGEANPLSAFEFDLLGETNQNLAGVGGKELLGL